MDDRKARFRFPRRIPKELRGRTYATESEFKAWIDVGARAEALANVPEPLLKCILDRIALLKAAAATEEMARATIRSLLSQVESAIQDASAVRSEAASTSEVMIATKALTRLLEPLTEAREQIRRVLRAQSERMICEIGGLAPGEFAGKLEDLPVSSDRLKAIPGLGLDVDHRTLVFSAIEYFDSLGPRKFRWLAAVSLLAGGETITFVPRETTVSDAIERESKRMRETAYKCNPGWAASADEIAELKRSFPEPPLELLVPPADYVG